ncbi:flagellin [Oceaniglobus trochenteri]|uniref:flagellin n=1 Tax=Oceaniglobus trochenteri TaxID=2763260 RepID=UPI001CFFD6CE|nr:flagellin [Oceaniglobus trochenteri]
MPHAIGDLAMSLANRSSNLRIRSEINTLAQELSSGRKSDLGSALSGDLAPIALIERSLSNLSAYQTVTSETALFLGAAQTALGQISGHLEGLSGAAFDMENNANPALIDNFAKDAEGRFFSIASAMNAGIAGRSLFAGNATDSKPLDRPELVLSDLTAAIPPGADAKAVSDIVDAYFAPGAGFESNRYSGSNDAMAPLRVSADDNVAFGATAKSDAMRAALAATAKAALLDRGILAGDIDEQRKLIRASGLDLMGAGAEIAALRADIGIAEAKVERAQVRNGAERSALDLARADIVAADPFETASRLTAVQAQLETFYTVTARLSRLSLTEYLR